MKYHWTTKKWVTVLLHIAAWTLLFSLPYLLRPAMNIHETPHASDKAMRNTIFSIIMDVSWVLFFYLNALVFIPRLINKRKPWLFILALALCFTVLLSQGYFLWRLFLVPGTFNLKIHILFTFFVFLFMLASSTAFQMIRDRMRIERLTKEKETEYLKTELSFLRSQVSPHFMFNVLNNMVALARKQSEQLEPSLIKLSSLMRYMLYETDEAKVVLSREMEYLRSYIDLQQQRFGKKIIINVQLSEPDNEYTIEPMLLIPFVENAFKHGAGVGEHAQIDIELNVKNNILHLVVRNKYNDAVEEYKDKTSGIGLANVERRLQLLYKNEHTLHINKKDNWFTVSLQLNLH